jgi:hypothetical protein
VRPVSSSTIRRRTASGATAAHGSEEVSVRGKEGGEEGRDGKGGPSRATSAPPRSAPRRSPRIAILITQTRQTGAGGDNSNSQYASLGLRACHDANITLPPDVLHLARKWWTDAQSADEAESKAGKNAGRHRRRGREGPGLELPERERRREGAYHAMTAGAVGAVVIYDYMLGKDWKKDAVATAGCNWLGKHFAVNANPYYMYALERAGMLYGTEKFGDHDWYLEGAKSIVRSQKADGSWGPTPTRRRTRSRPASRSSSSRRRLGRSRPATGSSLAPREDEKLMEAPSLQGLARPLPA